jgi:HEAT repeat protein
MRAALLVLFLDPGSQISELGSEDPAERERATERLLRAGASAVPALVQALGHSDPEIRARAQSILERMRYLPEETRRLYPVVEDLRIRYELAALLCDLRAEPFDQPAFDYRAALVKFRKFTELGAAALPALMELASTGKPEVRFISIVYLGELRDPRAAETLRSLRHLDIELIVREPEGPAVARLGDVAERALQKIVESPLDR